MRYKLVLIITLFTLISCNKGNQGQEKHQAIQKVQISTDLNKILFEAKSNKVTARFLSLVQHIDSAGYISDTTRYKPDLCITHPIDSMIFFEIQKEHTAPFLAFALIEEDKKEVAQNPDLINYPGPPPYYEEMKDFDIKPLKKAQQVVEYYFRIKKSAIVSGQKLYTDGIIEEWTFENEQQATEATKTLINAPLCIIYFNTCAFVCQKEKQMYIFHARAAAFMYTQKDFFNWFVKQNNISLYTEPTI